jgi:mannan endo-1,4-beta-mannosidase
VLVDIDSVSASLGKLNEANVPVIWRPLPVASNGLYWWGIDKETYKWLWQVMYDRMTDYHKLNNLVWVWSAQNADWYVGDEFCDILSVDVYTDGSRDAQINTMLFLHNINSTKPLAISECGNLPAIESILREKALWSYTGLYTEPYLGKELCNDEEFETKSAAQERITNYYNNNYTLTLDELPSIPDVAKAIRDAAKKDGRAKTKTKEKGSDREMYEDGYYYEDEYYEEEENENGEDSEDYTEDYTENNENEEELLSQDEEDDGYWSDIYY